MAKPKSRETWLHPSDVTEALKSSLASVAPTIRFSWITSRSAKPRAAAGVMICIDTVEAQRIEKMISLAKKSKTKAEQLKLLSQEIEGKIEKVQRENALLKTKVSELEELVHGLESNNESLRKNLDDRELLIQSARQDNRASHAGLAKLSDRGAYGLPLQGGLPGLGKKAK